jgi:hypothetical protein
MHAVARNHQMRQMRQLTSSSLAHHHSVTPPPYVASSALALAAMRVVRPSVTAAGPSLCRAAASRGAAATCAAAAPAHGRRLRAGAALAVAGRGVACAVPALCSRALLRCRAAAGAHSRLVAASAAAAKGDDGDTLDVKTDTEAVINAVGKISKVGIHSSWRCAVASARGAARRRQCAACKPHTACPHAALRLRRRLRACSCRACTPTPRHR